MTDGLNSTVEFPWPPKELTPNFKRRKHWSVYRAPTKRYREDCYWLTREAKLAIAAGDVPVRMTITFCPPDRRRRDDDGMISAFKAGRDGMAEALGVDDHTFRPTYIIGEPVKGGRVQVTILSNEARPIGEIIKPIMAEIEARLERAQ